MAAPAINANWPQQSPEQIERAQIMAGVASIKEQFTAMGGNNNLGGSAEFGAIVQYLRAIGTPLSYKIYQEMKASGQLPPNA